MAVVTPAAPAATEEDKELLISGSEAVAEALTLADLAQVYEAYDTLRELSLPGAHLVPGHDAEVMSRFPRVDGPAAGFAVEIR